MPEQGEQFTGTRDEHYDLVSVLYHALQAGTTIRQYVDDARARGDDELADFFERVQATDRERAEEAKQLLAARTRELVGT